MKKEDVLLMRKGLSSYFGAFPRLVFNVVYTVVTIPLHVWYFFCHRERQNDVTFCLLDTHRMKLERASSLIYSLRLREGKDILPPRPSLFQMFISLWIEWRSSCWKIGTVIELEAVREELCKHVLNTPFAFLPRDEIFVWAIDDRWKTFVGYCPFTGHTTLTTPRRVVRSLVQGKAPDSQEEHFAYAVSVTPRVSTN